jgi:hypothetical protein
MFNQSGLIQPNSVGDGLLVTWVMVITDVTKLLEEFLSMVPKRKLMQKSTHQQLTKIPTERKKKSKLYIFGFFQFFLFISPYLRHKLAYYRPVVAISRQKPNKSQFLQ